MLRKGVIVAASLAAMAAIGLLVLLILLNWTPGFYVPTVAPDEDMRASLAKQFVNRATQLANDMRNTPDWEALFTEQQMNAWLAEQASGLARRYLPDQTNRLTRPQIALQDGEVRFGLTHQGWLFSTVVWGRAQLWASEPGKVAVRLREVRIGALPLSATGIFDLVSSAAQRAGAPVEWMQVEGDPVAVVDLRRRASLHRLRRIAVIEQGVYISGSAEPHDALPSPQRRAFGASIENSHSPGARRRVRAANP